MDVSRGDTAPRVAVILAAGRGSRLLPHTEDIPKCLLDLGGRSILQMQIESFLAAAIDEVHVVTGFAADLVASVCSAYSGVHCIENFLYASTNSLYSMGMARAAVGGRAFVLANGDVLFHHEILRALLDSSWPSALMLDTESGKAREEMKVRVHDGAVAEIAKSIAPDDSDGENVGLLKFSARGAIALFDAADRIIGDGGAGEWAPRAYNEVIRNETIGVIATGELPWIEIDTAEDLFRAREMIYPACAPRDQRA